MKKTLVMAAVMLCLVGVESATAQGFRWGPELSLATDTDLGLGARVEFDLGGPPLTIIGSFDYYFPDGSVDYFEFNGNLVYNFNIPSAPTITPYAGGGLNIAHASWDTNDGEDRSDTDPGLNILGGARFDVGSVILFGEMKFTIEGGDQFVVTGGVLF
jgi:opacity protein-like surface antigen